MIKQYQEHIRIMRTAGYSYKQIADVLAIKKDTVKNHCLRNHIHPAVGVDYPAGSGTRYRLCPNCRKLFVVESNHQKQFCSDKCRFQYWKKERDYEASLEAENKVALTLKKELDLLPKKRDELDGGSNPAPLGRRKEVL